MAVPMALDDGRKINRTCAEGKIMIELAVAIFMGISIGGWLGVIYCLMLLAAIFNS